MEYKQIIGAKGEEKACKYLKMKGYQIMEKNYRCKLGEIDIIAKDKNKEIVFIEVKTRSNLKYGNPAEAVNSGKQIHIKKVASYFLLNVLVSFKIGIFFSTKLLITL